MGIGHCSIRAELAGSVTEFSVVRSARRVGVRCLRFCFAAVHYASSFAEGSMFEIYQDSVKLISSWNSSLRNVCMCIYPLGNICVRVFMDCVTPISCSTRSSLIVARVSEVETHCCILSLLVMELLTMRRFAADWSLLMYTGHSCKGVGCVAHVFLLSDYSPALDVRRGDARSYRTNMVRSLQMDFMNSLGLVSSIIKYMVRVLNT